jgi:hypothetical protein
MTCESCDPSNLTPYTAGFRAGYQQAAYDTYALNVIAAAARDVAADVSHSDRALVELEAALAHHARWQDWPEGDDHLILSEN